MPFLFCPLYWIVLNCIELYCIVLYWIILYCIALYLERNEIRDQPYKIIPNHLVKWDNAHRFKLRSFLLWQTTLSGSNWITWQQHKWSREQHTLSVLKGWRRKNLPEVSSTFDLIVCINWLLLEKLKMSKEPYRPKGYGLTADIKNKVGKHLIIS